MIHLTDWKNKKGVRVHVLLERDEYPLSAWYHMGPKNLFLCHGVNPLLEHRYCQRCIKNREFRKRWAMEHPQGGYLPNDKTPHSKVPMWYVNVWNFQTSRFEILCGGVEIFGAFENQHRRRHGILKNVDFRIRGCMGRYGLTGASVRPMKHKKGSVPKPWIIRDLGSCVKDRVKRAA